MKINLWGVLSGFSGYAVHMRNLAMALLKNGMEINIETQLTDVTSVPKELLPHVNKQGFEADVELMITVPDVWPLKTSVNGKKFIVGYGIFEGDRIPYNWEKRASDPNIDLIICPSEHAKKAFECTGKKIVVIPHGYNPDVFNTNVTPAANIKKDDRFRFLYVGGWSDGEKDRRGLDIAIKALVEEFKTEKDQVQFVAKINTAYQPLDTVIQNIAKLNLGDISARPEISILYDNYAEPTLASVYRACDVFIMPSKAEAFCMPCLEAMACGLPVVTTNYGGQTDFVNEKNGWLIDIESMQKATGGINYERAQWAKPSQKHLQQVMRHLYQNRQIVKQLGATGAEQAKQYTWDSTAKRMIEVFKNELVK